MKSKTVLTKAEAKYLHQMFEHETPSIKKVKDIKQLPLDWAGFFMENRALESKKVWPLNHSLAEKYLSAHGLPLKTTHAQWEAWVDKQYMNQRIRTTLENEASSRAKINKADQRLMDNLERKGMLR